MKKLPFIALIIVVVLYLATCSHRDNPVDKSRIDRITGVEFPRYVVTKIENKGSSWMGDFKDEYTLEFRDPLSDSFYDQIDRKISEGDSCWSKDGDTYYYYIVWGNGKPAPEGENEEADGIISISLIKGSKTFTITNGAW